MVSKESWWLYNILSFITLLIAAVFSTYYLFTLITTKPSKSQEVADDSVIAAISNDQNKRTYRGSIAGVFCYALSSISLVFMFIAFFIYFSRTGLPNKPLFITLWDGFGLLCYTTGIWCMLFTFLLRIDHAFKSFNHTLLPYPKCLIQYLYIHCIFIGILMLLVIITYATSAYVALSVIAITCTISIVSYVIIVLYLLFRKLFRMFVIRGTADNDDSNSEAQVIELDTLQTTTRYASLILIGVISTLLFTTTLAVEQPLYVLFEFDLPGGVFIGSDILVNATALFLMFTVNKDKYDKCCAKYHWCLFWCCISCAYKGDIKRKQTKEEYAALILNDSVVL